MSREAEDTMKIVVLGPPGAGKGTQCAQLQQVFRVLHVSTGQLLHREMEQGTELGEQVRPMVYDGRLVPDELVNKIVKTQLSTEDDLLDHGWVLDGFPRTDEQASFLSEEEGRLQPDLVLVMKLSRDVAAERIRHRVVDAARQRVWSDRYEPLKAPVGESVVVEEDDRNEEAIKRRLEEFELHIDSVVEVFRAAGLSVVEINADRDVEAVTKEVMGVITGHFHQGMEEAADGEEDVTSATDIEEVTSPATDDDVHVVPHPHDQATPVEPQVKPHTEHDTDEHEEKQELEDEVLPPVPVSQEISAAYAAELAAERVNRRKKRDRMDMLIGFGSMVAIAAAGVWFGRRGRPSGGGGPAAGAN